MPAAVSTTTVEIACPCGRTVVMGAMLAGRQFACSVCGRSLVVPGSPAAAPVRPGASSHLRIIPLVLLAVASGFAGWMLRGATQRPAEVGPIFEPAGVASGKTSAPEPRGGDPDRRAVLEYLKRYGNDPAAVELIDCVGPVPCPCNWNQTIPCNSAVLATFRSRNVFGAVTAQSKVFYLRNYRVVDTMDRATGYGYWRAAMQDLFHIDIP